MKKFGYMMMMTVLLGVQMNVSAQQYDDIESAWCDSVRRATDYVVRDSVVRQGDLQMPLWWTVYGEMPEDGRSLWISLHGGGGTTQQVNDGQWRNQKRLYRPDEGVYLAPRAPWNAWDMWFQAPIDAMFMEVIRTMVSHYGVNPDKVYIVGYSAGGDGVWRLAPRMTDRWAAASMMAGHPGDVSLVNLRNMPFMIWMGGEDKAYDRNRLAAVRGVEMDSLQSADPKGYFHETHILPGKPHWMDGEDRAAIPWLTRFRRQPWPRRVIWRQEEVLKESSYWVSVPRDEMQKGKRVDLSVRGNTIRVERCDYSRLTLRLSSELLKLDKKVKVTYRGKVLYNDHVKASADTYARTLHQMQDVRMASAYELQVRMW